MSGANRTYRQIDTPVKLFGLAWRQWALVVAAAAIAYLLIQLLSPPAPIAVWLAATLVGVPVAGTYYSSDAQAAIGTQLGDRVRWRLCRRRLAVPDSADGRRGLVIERELDQ